MGRRRARSGRQLLGNLLRTGWNLLALVGVMAICYSAGLLLLIYAQSGQDEAAPADAIVVLGTAQWNGRPSPVLRARLDHAIGLYQQGLAPLLITTGGNGPDQRFSEGGVGQAYAAARGVPEEALLAEEEGETSWESLRHAAELLHARGLRRIVLVSDPFHMMRLKLMARELGLEPYASPTRTSPISRSQRAELFYMLREAGGVTAHLLERLLPGLDRW
jgi:uncharacterized SAM-binding protein YcdF (DUF218 family)